jgi:hypothetical protein
MLKYIIVLIKLRTKVKLKRTNLISCNITEQSPAPTNINIKIYDVQSKLIREAENQKILTITKDRKCHSVQANPEMTMGLIVVIKTIQMFKKKS